MLRRATGTESERGLAFLENRAFLRKQVKVEARDLDQVALSAPGDEIDIGAILTIMPDVETERAMTSSSAG